MRTTVGQLLVNRTLPEEMRDYSRTLDKKTMKKLFSDLAKKYPEEYRQVSHQLSQIGHEAAYTTGGNSFGLAHMMKAKAALKIQAKLRRELVTIMADNNLTDDQRDEKLVATVGKYSGPLQKAVFDESTAEKNPLARQVSSGSRGNPMNLNSLRGADLLYTDHRDRVLPIPVLRSYSEGLTPLEYWAGTYGARKGVIDTKFATQDAGFLSKQLNQIAHRSMVTGLDSEKEPGTLRGFPVDTSDEDSEGSLLAHEVGGFKRNTILTPKILDALNRKGVKRILVRSPAVGGPSDGGVYARDVGVREFGRLPVSGENVGMAAAQALSEPLSQAQLSSKHAGGVAGASASQAVSGFDFINQLVQVPKQFKGGAAHSNVDGLVQRIEDGPAGGKHVWIENKKHFVGKGFNPLIARGDKVEAGDVISEGIPNPSIIVKHKGIGEGRRYFINAFYQAFRDAGITANRRNIELLSRGLIDHVRLTEEVGDYAPDDVVHYSQLESGWKPRMGHHTLAPKAAVGKYLERPYLHYSVGDKIRPSMLRDFEDFGIKEVDVHEEEPPFQAEMIRGMSNLQHDPDWVTRMFGSGQKSSVLGAVHRGGTSSMTGTSFVPGLAHGVNFGEIGKIQTPQVSTTKIGQFSQAAVLLLEKRSDDEANQHARQVQAIQHILKRIQDKNKYWKLVRRQMAAEQAGRAKAYRSLTGDIAGTAGTVAQYTPWSWPMIFTSGGSYAPIADEYGNTFTDDETAWWHQSGKHNLKNKGEDWKYYRDLDVFGGTGAPDMSSIQQPERDLHSTKLMEYLKEQYPDAYTEAEGTHFTPDKTWESYPEWEREGYLRNEYTDRDDPAPHRTWTNLAASEKPPMAYMQLHPEYYDQQRQMAQEQAMNPDPEEAEIGMHRYLDLTMPSAPGPVVNNDISEIDQLVDRELLQAGVVENQRTMAVRRQLRNAYVRGDITPEQAQQYLIQYRNTFHPHSQQQQPAQQAPGTLPPGNQVLPRPEQRPEQTQTKRQPVAQVGQQNLQNQERIPDLGRMRWQMPQNQQQMVNTVSGTMQAAMMANPQGARQMIGSMGPAGVGALGLMIAPTETMGLLRGPDKTQNRAVPKINEPMKPMKPAMPGGSVGKPIKVPGMKSKTMTPS